MKRIARALIHSAIIGILTVLTQIGGIAYLGALAIATRWPQRRGVVLGVSTIAIYATLTFAVVPLVAPLFGRERISCPVTTLIGCVLNRTYARPQAVALVDALNADLARRYPGSRVTVLDAGFPFVDGFALLPHLSHSDGRKLDLAFFYRDRDDVAVAAGAPSPIGYFHFERPRAGELARCTDRPAPLRWDFAWAQPAAPDWFLDEERTRFAIQWWKDRPDVRRILIEPYLAERLGVSGGKVRFQGCNAARHDDHFHVEIK